MKLFENLRKLFVRVLIFIFSIKTSLCQTLRAGNDPMIIVGLYHRCSGDENVTQSNICQAAVDYAYQNSKSNWNKFLKKTKYDGIVMV